MQFKDYEAGIEPVIFYPQRGDNLTYTLLGLTEEAGEAAGKLKKAIRDHNGQVDKAALLLELGDVLFYLAVASQELGSSLTEVAQLNLNKLLERKKRGTLGGSGDNR